MIIKTLGVLQEGIRVLLLEFGVLWFRIVGACVSRQ